MPKRKVTKDSRACECEENQQSCGSTNKASFTLDYGARTFLRLTHKAKTGHTVAAPLPATLDTQKFSPEGFILRNNPTF